MKDYQDCSGVDLDNYHDGALPAAASALVEAHLAACAACRAELESLAALSERARRLPAEVAPARDLWPEIAARIPAGQDASDRSVVAIDFQPARRNVVRTRWLAAAAAIVLVVISSATTAYFMRHGSEQRLATGSAAVQPLPSAQVGLAAFEPAEDEYLYAVTVLEAALEAGRDRLLPETVVAVEENLAIIDRAIAEASQALAADPTSAELPLLLSSVYRRKIELLQQAVDLSARS